jgi:hypothetical protein
VKEGEIYDHREWNRKDNAPPSHEWVGPSLSRKNPIQGRGGLKRNIREKRLLEVFQEGWDMSFRIRIFNSSPTVLDELLYGPLPLEIDEKERWIETYKC